MSAKPGHQPGEVMLSDEDLLASLSGDSFLKRIQEVGVRLYLQALAEFFNNNVETPEQRDSCFLWKEAVVNYKSGKPEGTMVVKICKVPSGSYQEGDIVIILTFVNGRQYILDMMYGKPFSFSDGESIQDVSIDTASSVGDIGRQALSNMKLFLESYMRGRESGQHQAPDRVAELLQ